MIFASKSATSQEDWGKIFSDDTSKLTPVENQEIDKLDEESKKDGMILLKIILRRRLSTTDANHVIDILDRYDNVNKNTFVKILDNAFNQIIDSFSIIIRIYTYMNNFFFC